MISYLSFWVHSFPFHPYSKHDISWKYGLLYILGGLPPNGWRSWPAAGTATGNNDIADREVEALPTDSVLYISRSHIPYWNSQLPVRSPLGFFLLCPLCLLNSWLGIDAPHIWQASVWDVRWESIKHAQTLYGCANIHVDIRYIMDIIYIYPNQW